MSNPRRRQLLLALISLVSIGATALIAAAAKPVAAPTPWTWVASWATGVGGAGAGKSTDGFNDETLRMFVHTSVGGSKVRIRLSNRYGKQPLTIGHATVALPFGANGGPGDLKPGSVKDLTFFGQKSVTIPTGGNAVSDGIDFDVPALQDLAISLYFPVATGPTTWHLAARETAYFGKSDTTMAASGATLPQTRSSWFYLNGLDVWNDNAQGSIAVLGDSITDGFKSTINGDKRWTDLLAARLAKEAKGGKAPGVVNLGMAGNRTGLDGTDQGFPELGYNTSARFESDVLSQPAIKAVILEIGINDIWISKDEANNIICPIATAGGKGPRVGPEDLHLHVVPLERLPAAARCHQLHAGARLDTAHREFVYPHEYRFRWVHRHGAALRNPADPTKLKPEWDSGDHIHPNDIGNGIMASAVPKDFVLW
jgi:lysophospholipase L1-like esterase